MFFESFLSPARTRREGRYLFRARWPACLAKNSTSAFRISLRTADYKVAAARAALIGSWMLNVKAADDPEAALRALWPRLQALAVEPAGNEADHVERSAFQLVVFEAQYRVRRLGLKPDMVVPGWDEHFVGLVRENSKAAKVHAKAATVEGRVERRRQELFDQGADPAATLRAPPSHAAFGSPLASLPVAKGDKRSPLSAVLAGFLKWREGEDGDQSAANDIAPVVQFAIDLWGDPCLQEFDPIKSFNSSGPCRRYPPQRAFQQTSDHFSSAGRSRRQQTIPSWMPTGRPSN